MTILELGFLSSYLSLFFIRITKIFANGKAKFPKSSKLTIHYGFHSFLKGILIQWLLALSTQLLLARMQTNSSSPRLKLFKNVKEILKHLDRRHPHSKNIMTKTVASFRLRGHSVYEDC